MFERFTDRARRVVVLAQEEARNLNHNYIGTEHILLGLIHEGEGVAAQALEAMGIPLNLSANRLRKLSGKVLKHLPDTFLSLRGQRKSSSIPSAKHYSWDTTTLAPSTFCWGLFARVTVLLPRFSRT